MRCSKAKPHGRVPLKYLSHRPGHPRAKHVYTWAYEDDDKQIKTITVLEIPPVDSAQTAVGIWRFPARARK